MGCRTLLYTPMNLTFSQSFSQLCLYQTVTSGQKFAKDEAAYFRVYEIVPRTLFHDVPRRVFHENENKKFYNKNFGEG